MSKSVAQRAILIALYVVVTVGFAPISYGPIQVRLGVALYILAGVRPDFVIPLTLATGLANICGGYGLPDIILGSAVTFVTCFACAKVGPSRWNFLTIPTVSAPLLALYLHPLFKLPYFETAFLLFIGQFTASTFIGLPLFEARKRLGIC